MKTYAALKALKRKHKHLTLGIHTVISNFNVDTFPALCEYVQRELQPDSYITEIAEERVELDTVGLGITPTAEKYTVAIDTLLESMRDQHLTGVAQVTQAFRRQYYEIVKRTLREHRQVIPCMAGVASAQIAPNGLEDGEGAAAAPQHQEQRVLLPAGERRVHQHADARPDRHEGGGGRRPLARRGASPPGGR
jgi:hypothetical protein